MENKKSTGKDIVAGFVVFLVALPLCLGIALASGAPLFSGLIAGIVGGIVVTSISHSAIGVSGPAAGLAVIVATAIADLGFEPFLLAVVLAGLIQIVAGFGKIGILGQYFPSSVIKGMLAGIGVSIFLKQIPHALGFDRAYEGEIEFFQQDGMNTFSEIVHAFMFPSIGAVMITIVSLAILIFWNSERGKKISFINAFPGPLLVVLLGVGMNQLYSVFIPEWTLNNTDGGNTHLVNLPVLSTFEDFKSVLTFPDFSMIGEKGVWITALTLAVVASLETLLSVEASDKLDPLKRITPTNRELIGQGVGNTISGLIGGIPVTQVIVRTTTNVVSGGRGRASAFSHGIFLLVCVILIPATLNLIPLASLAAILLMIGYKLASPKLFVEQYENGRVQFIPFIVTILGLVFTDMLTGIGIGMVVAFFHILLNNYRTPFNIEKETIGTKETMYITLAEEVSFLNKASISGLLNKIPDNTKVVIDGSRSVVIDHDVIGLIKDFSNSAPMKNIDLEIKGILKLA
ncbi:SulP family inorganic anion transporter [Sediminitomix flava]|uniref:SulP family sulfate permease n=1 Tax=Sediminitomix flava TaxID=379075 RepID=A0A315ZAX7_SEDFL|nr:SulP family inorganic anion transporter [Sediminitomix flava]PWJ41978.1 SulP family sulfate permease [Sediminitomix flava]